MKIRFAAALLLLAFLCAICTGCYETDDVSPADVPSVTSSDESAPTALPPRGVWQDDVFNSLFCGVTFTLPDGWGVALDELINQTYAPDVAGMYRDDGQFAQPASVLYDMVSCREDYTAYVCVSYIDRHLGGIEGLSEEEYISRYLMADDVTNYLSRAEFGKISTAQIGGRTYTTITITRHFQDMDTYERYWFCGQEDYMIQLDAIATDAAELEMITRSFS